MTNLSPLRRGDSFLLEVEQNALQGEARVDVGGAQEHGGFLEDFDG